MTTKIEPLDLETTYLGLAQSSEVRVVPVGPDFWETIHENEAIGPRMVGIFPFSSSWDSWEVHPAGDEVVAVLAGAGDMLVEVDGEEVRVPLRAGQTVVVPRGVWHTLDVHEPGKSLHITWGERTEHRPR
ncbi:MAG: cupin domain-containing protein [Myxococcota bacterium]